MTETIDRDTGEIVDDDSAPTSFAVWFARLERGQVNAQMSELLAELCQAIASVREQVAGKTKIKGTIGVDINFTCEDEIVRVEVKPKLKKPLDPRGSSGFWLTHDGKLVDHNPRQADMFRDIKNA